jgi:3-phosphoshikimate 1-carboxyvinyltransferase
LKLINRGLSGTVQVIGDKSISHRAILFSALAEGTSVIKNLLISEDTKASLEIVEQMGADVKIQDKVSITGQGINGLKKPKNELNAKNSGTTARLLIGLLSKKEINFNPKEYSFSYQNTKVPSAQVKSALILASLYHNEPTLIEETVPTRDHTERMLVAMGVDILRLGNTLTVPPTTKLEPLTITIPGDISSGAFLIALGLLRGKEIILSNMLINERRLGFIKVLKRMEAKIEILNIREENNEVIGDIKINKSILNGTTVSKDEIPDLIDEIPIFTLLASQAKGLTKVVGAEELKVKESNRLDAMKNFILNLGGEIKLLDDGFEIQGIQKLKKGKIETLDDHRIAMTAIVANIGLNKKIIPDNFECINDSYPSFFEDIKLLGGEINE